MIKNHCAKGLGHPALLRSLAIFERIFFVFRVLGTPTSVTVGKGRPLWGENFRQLKFSG
jgi:hypothetical protein